MRTFCLLKEEQFMRKSSTKRWASLLKINSSTSLAPNWTINLISLKRHKTRIKHPVWWVRLPNLRVTSQLLQLSNLLKLGILHSLVLKTKLWKQQINNMKRMKKKWTSFWRYTIRRTSYLRARPPTLSSNWQSFSSKLIMILNCKNNQALIPWSS